MRFRVVLAATLAAVALTAGSEPASAACSISRFPIPVEMQGLRPTILAKVNGREVRFVLDSGSFYNGISARFAADQKMRAADGPPETGSRLTTEAETGFTGLAGAGRLSAVVQADKLEFADTDFGRAMFMTMPIKEGGLLGQNFLKVADVEYDFKNGSIFMVTAEDCKDASLAYWAKGPYSMLPLENDPYGHHTVATILVNGRKMRAIFDTGAEATFITRRAAARAGVQVTDPDVKESGFAHGVDGVPVKTWVTRFASVTMDTEEISKGLLEIGDTEAQDFDLLIGADFFLAHHIYVANSQKKIYFTHNGGSAFNAGPGPASGTGASSQGEGGKKN